MAPNTAEIELVLHFFEEIGIEAEFRTLTESTFLPGIKIEAGRLIIDKDRLAYPGDLLHEAGHIALVPHSERPQLMDDIEGDLPPGQSLEIGVILWSFAALRYLNLPLPFVFHEGGYKGQSKWYIEQFESGMYIGLPLLQWMGLAVDKKKAAEQQVKPFPFMLKWLRN